MLPLVWTILRAAVGHTPTRSGIRTRWTTSTRTICKGTSSNSSSNVLPFPSITRLNRPLGRLASSTGRRPPISPPLQLRQPLARPPRTRPSASARAVRGRTARAAIRASRSRTPLPYRPSRTLSAIARQRAAVAPAAVLPLHDRTALPRRSRIPTGSRLHHRHPQPSN